MLAESRGPSFREQDTAHGKDLLALQTDDVQANMSRDEVDKLISVLGDRNEKRWARTAAAETLTIYMYDRRATRPLIAILEDWDEHWDVRRAAAHGLRMVGDARAIKVLVNSLTDRQWRIRAEAVLALGHIARRTGNTSALMESIVAMLKDSHKGVRWAARETLDVICSQ